MRRSLLLGAGLLSIVLLVASLWRSCAATSSAPAEEVPGHVPAPLPSAGVPPLGSSAPPADAGTPNPAGTPSPVVTRPARPAKAAPSLVSLSEAALMARLRSAAGSDNALAIALARAGNLRFPDSADAPERTSILIHALANKGLAGQARGEAEDMVNHYPDSSWVREVEQFSGAHRHRNIHVTDAGTIEYR